MLAIKLSKTGKTNKKMFRLIISEKSRDPFGSVLEILGSYNPHSKELIAKKERINYWLSQGAQATATVNNLLVEKKIISGSKVVASKPGKKKKTKEAKPSASAQPKAEAKTDTPVKEKKTEVKTEPEAKAEPEVKTESTASEETKAE